MNKQNKLIFDTDKFNDIFIDTVEHWHYLRMYCNIPIDSIEADIAEHGQTHYKTYNDIFKIKSFFIYRCKCSTKR
jgi:hypothetical protein